MQNCLKKLALISLSCICLHAFAQATTPYHLTLEAPKAANGKNVATDIVIANNSGNTVYMEEPVHDVIWPSQAKHLWNDDYYGDTYLVLSNPSHVAFFEALVHNHAYLNVTLDYAGHYRVDVS